MKAVILYSPECEWHRIAGVVLCNYIYFDECREAAVRTHIEKNGGWDVKFDRQTSMVHFTTGGKNPFGMTYKMQILDSETGAVSIYNRAPIRTRDGGVITIKPRYW
jgi:hypothetical protein